MKGPDVHDAIERPLQVGPITLPRRVYLPAHQPGLAIDGRPGEAYISYHRERARAGDAMQVTGATPVAPSSEWADICLWNVDESIVPGYRDLAAAVHEEGGRILAQLAHPGPTETEGREVIGPSHDFSEVSQQVAVPATAEQLQRIVEEYTAAAERCVRGDLDGVEISMAHGLLLAAFLSPAQNRRDDDYGGDLASRMRFPLEVLRAVRAVLPSDRVLGVRLGVDDLIDGGLRPAEAAEIAAALEPEVDYFSIMVGNNNRRLARVRHWGPTPLAPGAFRALGRTIKARVRKPVAIVGRVLDLALADEIVASGDADLVGMVRAQIADPHLIPLSLEGETDAVRPCIGANVCIDSLLDARPLTCMVNPDAAAPAAAPPPSLAGMRALVVGAGPAGLESARRLALRGAETVLVDKSEALGGAMRHWTRSTSRREFVRIIEWSERALRRLGGGIRLGTDADAALAEMNPDLLVVATGARPNGPPLPTDGTVRVLTGYDDRRDLAGARVVVHDRLGRLAPVWVVEELVELGARPLLATSRLHAGEGEGVSTLYPALQRLDALGVEVRSLVELDRIDSGAVVLRSAFGTTESRIACDALIRIDAPEPVRLELTAPRVVTVGDAARPRDVTAAFADAREVVDAIR